MILRVEKTGLASQGEPKRKMQVGSVEERSAQDYDSGAVAGVEKTSAQKDRLWTKPFVFMFACGFFMHFGLEMTNTVMGKYVDSFGASAVTVGVIMSSFAITAIVARLFLGPAVDSFDMRKVLYLCLAAQGISFVLLGFSYNAETVLAARFVEGIGMASGSVCCLVMVSGSLNRRFFSRGIFVFSLSTAIAQTISPAIALLVVSCFGYHINFFIAAAFEVFAAWCASRAVVRCAPRRPYKLSLKSIIAVECLPAASILFLLKIPFFCITSFLLIYADSVGVTEGMGLYFTVYAVTMIIVRPFAGKLSDSFGLMFVLLPSIVMFGLSFFLISISGSLWMFLLSAIANGFGFANSQPALQTLAMESVEPDRRGSAASTCYMAQDLGNLVGPVIGGLAIESFGYSAMWIVMIIPIAAAFLLAVCLQKRFTLVQKVFDKTLSHPEKK